MNADKERMRDVLRHPLPEDEWLDRLAECVTPDPRIARVDALLKQRAHHDQHGDPWVSWEALNDALYSHDGDPQPDKDAEERLLEAEATLARIEALCDEVSDGAPIAAQVLAILRGES